MMLPKWFRGVLANISVTGLNTRGFDLYSFWFSIFPHTTMFTFAKFDGKLMMSVHCRAFQIHRLLSASRELI